MKKLFLQCASILALSLFYMAFSSAAEPKKVTEAESIGVFAPDSKSYVTCHTQDDTKAGKVDLKIYDLGSGKMVKAIVLNWPSRRGYPIRAILLAISSDNNTLVTSDGGMRMPPDSPATTRCVQIWDVATGKLKGELTLGRPPQSVSISADGKLVAAGGRDAPVIKIWDVATQQVKRTLGQPKDASTSILRFSPDGKMLAYLNAGKEVTVWEVGAGKLRMPWVHLRWYKPEWEIRGWG